MSKFNPISLQELCSYYLPINLDNVKSDMSTILNYCLKEYKIKNYYKTKEIDKFSLLIGYHATYYGTMLLLYDKNNKELFYNEVEKPQYIKNLFRIIKIFDDKFIKNTNIELILGYNTSYANPNYGYAEEVLSYKIPSISYSYIGYRGVKTFIKDIILNNILINCPKCDNFLKISNSEGYNLELRGSVVKYLKYGVCGKCIDKVLYTECYYCRNEYHTGGCIRCILCFKIITYNNDKKTICRFCLSDKPKEVKEINEKFRNKFIPSRFKLKIYDMLRFLSMEEYMEKFI